MYGTPATAPAPAIERLWLDYSDISMTIRSLAKRMASNLSRIGYGSMTISVPPDIDMRRFQQELNTAAMEKGFSIKVHKTFDNFMVITTVAMTEYTATDVAGYGEERWGIGRILT